MMGDDDDGVGFEGVEVDPRGIYHKLREVSALASAREETRRRKGFNRRN